MKPIPVRKNLWVIAECMLCTEKEDGYHAVLDSMIRYRFNHFLLHTSVEELIAATELGG